MSVHILTDLTVLFLACSALFQVHVEYCKKWPLHFRSFTAIITIHHLSNGKQVILYLDLYLVYWSKTLYLWPYISFYLLSCSSSNLSCWPLALQMIKKTRVTAKNAIFAASAIHFLSILSILFQQNTIKFVKEEQTTIIMGNGNKNVNYYLAFVLCLRIIKTAAI